MKKRCLPICLLLFAWFAASCTPAIPSLPTATTVPTLAATIAHLAPPNPSLTPTWTLPPEASPVTSFIAIHMIDGLRGWSWAGSPDGAFRLLHTTTGVKLWNEVTPKGFSPALSDAYFLDANVAWIPLVNYASNATRLVQTLDGGDSWKTVSERLPFAHAILHFQDTKTGWAIVSDMGAGNAHYRVFETHNGGSDWSPTLITAPAADADVEPNSVHLCNLCGDTYYYDPDRIVIAHGDMGSMTPGKAVRISVSQDKGKTWKDVKLPLPSERYDDGLVTPLTPVFFNGNSGILPVRIQKTDISGAQLYQVEVFYRTQDGGMTWQSLPGIVENAISSEPPSILSVSDIILRCGSALCRSQDGIKSWLLINPNIRFSTNTPDQYVSAFQFIDPQTGWAIYTDEGTAILYQSIDGGAQWEKVEAFSL
jgi:photosystem II stability/assembly factor-like uncharacterized protein